MTPAVDEGQLRGLLDDMGGDREVVKELIQSYLEEAPKLIAALRAAVLAGDVDSARRACHTLKSASAAFGALELASRAKEFEEASRAGTLPPAGAPADLEGRFAAVRRELLARLG